MRRAFFLVVVLAASVRAQSASTAAAGFALEQPDRPFDTAFPGEERPLFGQAPPFRFVEYAAAGEASDSDSHQAVLREIRFLRDFYRHEGLYLPVEERVFEVRAESGTTTCAEIQARLDDLGIVIPGRTLVFTRTGTDDAAPGVECVVLDPRSSRREGVLRAARRLFGLADATSSAGLSERDVEALRKRYSFPPPAPASDPFHRPAVRDYRATDEDFRMLERGLSDASKVSEKLFPGLIADVDVVLYDTSELYIYSRNDGYPFPKLKKWRGYQVYRVAHHSRPEEHEMWGCAGGLSVLNSDLRRPMGELFFACAPWGSFQAVQKKRRTIYRFKEGYWASVIHEYGHQYQERMAANPTPEMDAIEAKIDAMKLDERTSAYSAAREGFANWCELKGARALYPDQYRRMLDELKRTRRDDAFGHDAGLAAAAAVIREEDEGRTRDPAP